MDCKIIKDVSLILKNRLGLSR